MAEFIGLAVLVTLRDPLGAKLRGTILGIDVGGLRLTLANGMLLSLLSSLPMPTHVAKVPIRKNAPDDPDGLTVYLHISSSQCGDRRMEPLLHPRVQQYS